MGKVSGPSCQGPANAARGFGKMEQRVAIVSRLRSSCGMHKYRFAHQEQRQET